MRFPSSVAGSVPKPAPRPAIASPSVSVAVLDREDTAANLHQPARRNILGDVDSFNSAVDDLTGSFSLEVVKAAQKFAHYGPEPKRHDPCPVEARVSREVLDMPLGEPNPAMSQHLKQIGVDIRWDGPVAEVTLTGRALEAVKFMAQERSITILMGHDKSMLNSREPGKRPFNDFVGDVSQHAFMHLSRAYGIGFRHGGHTITDNMGWRDKNAAPLADIEWIGPDKLPVTMDLKCDSRDLTKTYSFAIDPDQGNPENMRDVSMGAVLPEEKFKDRHKTDYYIQADVSSDVDAAAYNGRAPRGDKFPIDMKGMTVEQITEMIEAKQSMTVRFVGVINAGDAEDWLTRKPYAVKPDGSPLSGAGEKKSYRLHVEEMVPMETFMALAQQRLLGRTKHDWNNID